MYGQRGTRVLIIGGGLTEKADQHDCDDDGHGQDPQHKKGPKYFGTGEE